ncbi:hypothetical protein EZ428_10735 [Pedobacter frigiditerrae]|uniref:Tetratricopeptide repeat-containing protein n=1 Tax=Pedobacter frigiditerrae TaxID=2530452 RepID=A0A4V2MJ07_9SPHI|nr:hypothetical protein [Pedobacter frigiditerrae]TCC92196.1 hypothetical protein EZ428_10735 [Pedobacter frigiditerrae]
MMTEDKILWVARYVEGDMDEAEIAEFETQLKSDDELQQNLKDYNHIHQSLKMKLANNDEFKDTLKGFNKQYFGEEPKVISFKPALKWLSGIAAILVIGLFIWAPWNANLYDTYADDSQMLVTERGAATLTDLDKAAALYNEKNYESAKTALGKLYIKQSSNTMIAYYYGLSLIKTNALDEARKVLIVIYEGESVFKYEAAYSIALSYLKEDKKADAKTWLQKIPAGTTKYELAKELLGKM